MNSRTLLLDNTWNYITNWTFFHASTMHGKILSYLLLFSARLWLIFLHLKYYNKAWTYFSETISIVICQFFFFPPRASESGQILLKVLKAYVKCLRWWAILLLVVLGVEALKASSLFVSRRQMRRLLILRSRTGLQKWFKAKIGGWADTCAD